MRALVAAAVALLALAAVASAYDTRGVVSLDRYTFDKIVDGHRPVLHPANMPTSATSGRVSWRQNGPPAAPVKFDKKWSTNEAYKDVAGKVANSTGSTILVAEVDVSEYGEKEGTELAERFGVKKEDFPTYFLFLKAANEEPVKFAGDKSSSDDILRFVRKHGVYVGLPGCSKELDEIAAKFLDADSAARDTVLAEAQKLVEAAGADAADPKEAKKAKQSAENYLKIMQKIKEQGEDFVTKEEKRLEKLLADKSVEKGKKESFRRKANAVYSFLEAIKRKATGK
eukprot:tig00020710_g13392.t1